MNRWYQTVSSTSPSKTCLRNAFEIALGRGTSPQTYLFEDIYIPIPKINKDYYTYERVEDPDHPGEYIIVEVIPEELQGLDPQAFHEPYEYKYVNVGMSVEDIVDYYWTKYGCNMFCVPIVDRATSLTGDLTLGKKMNVIVKANMYKYIKWIADMGYAYNPLWNVDGTDWFQYIDNHGNVTTNRSPILQTSVLNQVTTDANATLRNAEKTSMGYNYTTEEQVSGLTDITQETHGDITDSTTPKEIDGPVIAITGGDFSHIEKRIRQGNIGVTQTSELIKNERDLVRFNIIEEFFKDVNKELLMGIYPGF